MWHTYLNSHIPRWISLSGLEEAKVSMLDQEQVEAPAFIISKVHRCISLIYPRKAARSLYTYCGDALGMP